MRKLLFHIDTLVGGGAEKVLCNLVNHMDITKFDITVQTVFPENSSQYLARGIKYKSIYPSDNHLYRMIYRFEAALGVVYLFHMKDDYDVEIAYLEFGPTKVIASSTNKKATKIAWIHCDFEIAIKDKQQFIKKAQKWYNKYDKVVCVSEKCRKSYVSMFGNEPKAVVLHNVIDERETIEKAKCPLPDNMQKNGLTLCTVGRLSSPKNYLRLLKAAFRLHEEGAVFTLWFVGDGEQRELLQKYINDNNMSSYVRMFGFQTNPYPFMKAADLLVCSSDYEGFSTFATEAVVLNKWFLTTDCSGMHEILDDYPYGIITQNDDEAFFNGLKNWLQENNNKQIVPISYRNRFNLNFLVSVTESFLVNC